MIQGFFPILFLLIIFASGSLRAEVTINPRELYILQGEVDGVSGSFLFAVQNTGSAGETARIPIMLPKETTDWQALEGATGDDMRLTEDGKIILEKKFPAGTTLIAIGFRLPASVGEAKLTFAPERMVPELFIMAPRGQLFMRGDGMAFTEDTDFSGKKFDRLDAVGLQVGKSYTIDVEGVPEGRGRLWFLGGIVGSALFILGSVFAFRTRPRVEDMLSTEYAFGAGPM